MAYECRGLAACLQAMRPFGLAAGLVPKSPSRLAEAGNPGWSEIVSSQARQTGLARRRSPTYARHVCTNSHLDIMRAPVSHVFSSYSPIPASPLSCCDHLACIRLSKLQTGNAELEEVARGGAGPQAGTNPLLGQLLSPRLHRSTAVGMGLGLYSRKSLTGCSSIPAARPT